MREQKNDQYPPPLPEEKGYFFRAVQCAALLSFRVGKMLFCKKKVCFFFTIFTKGCRSKKVGVFIYYIGKVKGYFLTGHREKGYQFQNVQHTV